MFPPFLARFVSWSRLKVSCSSRPVEFHFCFVLSPLQRLVLIVILDLKTLLSRPFAAAYNPT